MSQTQKYRYELAATEQLRKALAELEEQKTIGIRRKDFFEQATRRMAEQRQEIERLEAENKALKAELAQRESQGGGIHGVLCEARFPEQELKVYAPDERAFHVIEQAVRERMGHVEFIVFRSGPKP